MHILHRYQIFGVAFSITIEFAVLYLNKKMPTSTLSEKLAFFHLVLSSVKEHNTMLKLSGVDRRPLLAQDPMRLPEKKSPIY
jgi:hypothetical protein